MPSERTRWFLDLGVTIVIVATCGALVWANWDRIVPPSPPTIDPPTELVSVADAPRKGDPGAPFVLIEYSDYQCPYCGQFERRTLPAIQEAYIRTGRVRLAFRHHPVEGLHPFAPRAAAAAVCAADQGRFWEYHALLFANARNLDDAHLDELAASGGLDVAAFSQCLEGGLAAERVRRQVDEALRFGLTGTPAFLVGRVRPDGLVKALAVIPGAFGPAEFAARLDAALNTEDASTWSARLFGALAIGIVVSVAGWTWRKRRLELAVDPN